MNSVKDGHYSVEIHLYKHYISARSRFVKRWHLRHTTTGDAIYVNGKRLTWEAEVKATLSRLDLQIYGASTGV